MAEREEIEISQLELAEELAPDWVMPVEGATKTWATTLEKIRQFFGLDNKTNLNMDNLNADGKSLISGLGMPSNNYIDLTLGANNSTYTAPANGRLSLTKQQGGSTYNYNVIAINGLQYKSVTGGASGSTSTIVAPMKKGDVATILYTTTGRVEQFRFTYAEGEN